MKAKIIKSDTYLTQQNELVIDPNLLLGLNEFKDTYAITEQDVLNFDLIDNTTLGNLDLKISEFKVEYENENIIDVVADHDSVLDTDDDLIDEPEVAKKEEDKEIELAAVTQVKTEGGFDVADLIESGQSAIVESLGRDLFIEAPPVPENPLFVPPVIQPPLIEEAPPVVVEDPSYETDFIEILV